MENILFFNVIKIKLHSEKGMFQVSDKYPEFQFFYCFHFIKLNKIKVFFFSVQNLYLQKEISRIKQLTQMI